MTLEPGTTRSDARRLRGVLAPVLTPFHADLTPDARRLAAHCRWLLAHGCAGLSPFGTTSEANSLSVEERENLLDAVLEGGVPAERLVPGTGSCALPDAVRLGAYAVRRGCAGALMLPPFYYKAVGDDGLFRFFSEVIQRVGDGRLRVYLYHIPPVAQVGIGPKLVERLLRAYPRAIAGMKDSSGDMANTKAMLERFGKDGLDVFVGSERFLLEGMRAGGAGCITATGNVNPAAIDRLFREWSAPGAERLQEDVNAVRGLVEKVPVIPALKAIVASEAHDPAWLAVRPPLVELDPARREELVGSLRALGFSMPGLRS